MVENGHLAGGRARLGEREEDMMELRTGGIGLARLDPLEG